MDEETGYCSCFTTTAAGAALQQQLQQFVLADVTTEAIVVKQQKELKKIAHSCSDAQSASSHIRTQHKLLFCFLLAAFAAKTCCVYLNVEKKNVIVEMVFLLLVKQPQFVVFSSHFLMLLLIMKLHMPLLKLLL